MDGYKYDPKRGWYISKGWRSWGCVTALVQYSIVLIMVILEGIAVAIILLPAGAVILTIAFVIALIFGYI
jgi:hypothetical protein